MLRVRLLGELAIEADGERCEPPAPAKARGLLAWLALHPGAHSRSEVAGTFWPDVLEESARASLRTALSAVRRSLGGAADAHLLATREAVGLQDAWVDALAFAELTAAGRLEEALELGEGELLPSLDEEWARDARDEQRRRRAEVLAQVAERAGNPAEAVRLARARLALDPLSEEAARALIERLVAAGDRAGALVAYDELRERLRGTLAIAPSPATRALYDAIRRRAPGRPASSPLLDRRTAGVFVGREAERAGAAGARGLVVIEGDAGVGKTRLALELARDVRDAGGVALVGRCSEEPLRAYEAWAEALRPLLDDADDSEREAVAPLFGTGAAGEAEGERYALFEAVRELLANVADAWPLIIVLDDLHWADRPTLLLLAHLVRAPEGPPARLVGTYRSSELARDHPLGALLADARREQLADRVALRGLGARATAELVAASTGPDTPEPVALAVHAETGGNPFFVVEVARHLAETGASSLGEVGLPESCARCSSAASSAWATTPTPSSATRRCWASASRSTPSRGSRDRCWTPSTPPWPPAWCARRPDRPRRPGPTRLPTRSCARPCTRSAAPPAACAPTPPPRSACSRCARQVAPSRRPRSHTTCSRPRPPATRWPPPARPGARRARPPRRWPGRTRPPTPSAGCRRWSGSTRRRRTCAPTSCWRRARRRCARASAPPPARPCVRPSRPTPPCSGPTPWPARRWPWAGWGSSSAAPTRSWPPRSRPRCRPCRPTPTACARACSPAWRSSATTSPRGRPAGACPTTRWPPPAAPATTPPWPRR